MVSKCWGFQDIKQISGLGRNGVTDDVYGISLRGDDNVLKMIVVIVTQLNIPKTTGSYSLNG